MRMDMREFISCLISGNRSKSMAETAVDNIESGNLVQHDDSEIGVAIEPMEPRGFQWGYTLVESTFLS